jgi:hypothetical protein
LPATQIASGLNVVSVLTQLSDALKRSEAIARALEQDMSAKSSWQPTLKLADDAADILKSKGIPVIVAEKPLKLSSYSNQAINAWYNIDRATTDFTGLSSAHSPYVLEILQGSSVSNGSLMLELRMKLIDPTTGKVIGRRRDYELASGLFILPLFTFSICKASSSAKALTSVRSPCHFCIVTAACSSGLVNVRAVAASSVSPCCWNTCTAFFGLVVARFFVPMFFVSLNA